MLVRSTVSAREACAENAQTIGFRKFIVWSLEDMLFGSTVPPFQRCHLVGIQGNLALAIVIWAALKQARSPKLACIHLDQTYLWETFMRATSFKPSAYHVKPHNHAWESTRAPQTEIAN